MEDDKLKEGETFIRVCPHTKQLVLAQYVKGGIIDLHNETIEEDLKEVKEFFNKHINN